MQKNECIIYGNKALHKMLTQSVNSGHLCHAYLFLGKNGIGKKTIANYFAMGILCTSKAGNRPCFECNSCKKILQNQHPDFIVLDNNDEKSSLHILIDTIREVRQDAYILPNEGAYKIYLIPNVENMTIGAFNAFLKVLEDPPKTAIFLLTAESKSAVLPTILSRCISHELYPLCIEESMQALAALMPDKSEAERLNAAQLSNGILGKAIDILSSENYSESEKIKTGVLDGIIHMDEYEILKSLAAIKKDRKMLGDLLDLLCSSLRNAMLHKLKAITVVDKQLSALANSVTISQFERIISLLEQTATQIEANASIALLLHRMSAEIMTILNA